jgi:FkbM family methyltransferase
VSKRSVRRQGLTFHHRNEVEFELLYGEIFENREYSFTPSRDDPIILDCGSHIGLSVAWFKRRFPASRIIAFEPDPESFRLLQLNVATNGFDGVELINKAVSSRNGTARFFGEFGSDAAMACAHSLCRDWGTQRSDQSILVATTALADYISGPVDYLKIDIEGSEREVLPSIRDRLHLVRDAAIEFHGTGGQARREEDGLVELLQDCGFSVSVTGKATSDMFPTEIGDWVRRVQPHLSTIRASRVDGSAPVRRRSEIDSAT